MVNLPSKKWNGRRGKCHLGAGVKCDLAVNPVCLRRAKTWVHGLHCISVDEAPFVRRENRDERNSVPSSRRRHVSMTAGKNEVQILR
jgi:hypothetical protein